MKRFTVYFTVLSFFLFQGCSSGYEKQDGKWYFVSYSMPNGEQRFPLKDADDTTLKILDGEEHALDKKQVYFRGALIPNADPNTFQHFDPFNLDYAKDKNRVYLGVDVLENSDPASFERIAETDYSKDKTSVYLKHYRLLALNPKKFELLEFPYSKDENTIYCGNIPMLVKNPETFKVIKGNTGFTSASKSGFIDRYPTMAYCDSLIIGEYIYGSLGAYAEAEGQFFKDHLEVEKPDSLTNF